MAAQEQPDGETLNFVLIQKGSPREKPLPLQGTLAEAEILALHLLRPGEALCATSPAGQIVARWEAGPAGRVMRVALAAA